MKKIFMIFVILGFLTILSCAKKETDKENDDCNNFSLLGYFYKNENVEVKFNEVSIYKRKFDKKNIATSRDFCVNYTKNFRVSIKINSMNRILVDTVISGYYSGDNHRLVIPIGIPKRVDSISIKQQFDRIALLNKSMKLHPDSLKRTFYLETIKKTNKI